MLLMVLALSCARDPRMDAAARLQRGLEALERHDYERALAICSRCSESAPGRDDALRCWLLSAVSLRDWEQGLAAARQLTALYPDDSWLEAVHLEIEALVDPTFRTGGTTPAPELAWACPDGSCFPAGAFERTISTLPLASRSLVRALSGDPDGALETLQEAEPTDAAGADLRLLLLLKSGRLEELRNRVNADGCLPGAKVGPWAAAFMGAGAEPPRACAPVDPAAPGTDDSAASHLREGIHLLAANRRVAAVVALERAEAAAMDPTIPRIYLYLAHLLDEDFGSAKATLKRLDTGLSPAWQEWLVSLAPPATFP
jgi:hypothetical protein